MNITSAKVILTNLMDTVILYTDMPCPLVKEALPSQEPLALLFHTTIDTGADYIRKNFDIEPEILNTRS